MKQYETLRLVTGEDLNHHGTLFAARAAGWFVEAAFSAAACAYGKNEIVCRNLHNMSFQKPVLPGTVLTFRARVVYTGKSSFVVDVSAADALGGETAIEGMVVFVAVDGQNGTSYCFGRASGRDRKRETGNRKKTAAHFKHTLKGSSGERRKLKISIEEIDAAVEEEIIIRCHQVDQEILELCRKIKKKSTNFRSGKFFILKR